MPLPFVTLLASAARTVTGNYEFDLMQFAKNGQSVFPPQLLVQSDVTVVSGTTPSMTVLVQDSLDGVTWNTVGTFAAQTAASKLVIQIAISGVAQAAGFRWPFNPRRMRLLWTITGTTPSFTFSVKAAIL